MYMYVFIFIPHPLIDFAYSGMIAFRIWSVERASRKYRYSKSTLMPVLVVVIESGAIYSAFLIILLAVYLSHGGDFFMFSPIVSSFHNGINPSSSRT